MKKQWVPRVMGGSANRHDDPVVIEDCGSDSNGDYMYAVYTIDGSVGALTPGQWANLGIMLKHRHDFEALEDYEDPEESDPLAD